MEDKTENKASSSELINESLPVITEIVHELLGEIFKGEVRFTLFLTNGEMCGLSGDNGLEHTFEHLKGIMERYEKGETNFVNMNDINTTEH